MMRHLLDAAIVTAAFAYLEIRLLSRTVRTTLATTDVVERSIVVGGVAVITVWALIVAWMLTG